MINIDVLLMIVKEHPEWLQSTCNTGIQSLSFDIYVNNARNDMAA